MFVHDRVTRTTERVSVDSAGNQANDPDYPANASSYNPVLSADGRFVAFDSGATNLVPDGSTGVFVHDRQTGTTQWVVPGGYPALSADGRFVAFDTAADNLVPGEIDWLNDVFLRDRQTGTTERVSGDSDGGDNSYRAAISADGRFVAFWSLGPATWGCCRRERVFVRDRQTGTTELVSAGGSPALSADGRFVAFHSRATDLVPRDTNGTGDVFVHDRGAPASVTTTVNFDTPAPPGGSGPLEGVFEGIDFGTGQWAWEGAFDVDPTNHVYFANSAGTSRTFAFSPAPRVLESLRVFSPTPGTLTLSDDAGQTLTQEVTTGSMQLVTTGWTRPSTTVTVSFTNGWDLGVDDITYSTAP